MGLEAFDELHAAQRHPDIEVEMAARYLVSSLIVSWSKDSDHEDVQETLKEYGAQNEVERLSRIGRLASLGIEKSLPAMVRLARFETSDRLSRQAALKLMELPTDLDSNLLDRYGKQVVVGLADCERESADWLRVYATDLRDRTYSSDQWNDLIKKQRTKIDSASDASASSESVLKLVRICATRAATLNSKEEGIELATDNLDLIQPTSARLLDASTWAIEHDMFPVVLSIREEFSQVFDTQPSLVYYAAESLKKQDQNEEAERVAKKARQMNPFPTSKGDDDKPSESVVSQVASKHLQQANRLQRRGLFGWAEKEFLLIADSVPVDTVSSVLCRLSLAMMYGELERHQDVVDVLTPIHQRATKDKKFNDQVTQRLITLRFSWKKVGSDIDYHTAQAKLAADTSDEARELLRKAYYADRSNIDILIRMYRTKGDDDWRAEVKKEIAYTARTMERDIERARANVRVALNPFEKRVEQSRLAQELNNYAWLICNTEGDYQQALSFSLESLDIEKEDGAKCDTCARCYFVIGDFENAVEMQKKAIKFLPHSPPLVRQLNEFQAALNKQKKNNQNKPLGKEVGDAK